MKKLKTLPIALLLTSSAVWANQSGEYMYITNDLYAQEGSLAGKPLDLHVSGVDSDGVTPKIYIIPPKQTQQVYLWHDGTISDINVSYYAYYANTNVQVPLNTLTDIKVYYNGNNQHFPCNTNTTMIYGTSPQHEYVWGSLACN